MIEIQQSTTFKRWLQSLRDARARARIVARIDRMAEGNLGDAKPVGGGLSVMRIHYGPGYRVYLMQRGTALIILLCGGDNRIGEANRPRLADNIPMTEQFTPWDSAEYLQTDEDIAAYLDACFEEAGTDAELIIQALGTVARAKGIDRVAERAGLAPDHLHALLGSNASPPFGEILRVYRGAGHTPACG